MEQKLLGQDKALAQLKKFVRASRVPHAFLFCGEAGVGKALAAKTFAKILNCLDAPSRAEQNYCGKCLSCKSIEAGTHPDFVFADFAFQAAITGKELEKQQHISVDTVRKITASSQQKAAMGGWKIMTVDSAQSMQAEAQNALLKFIEEPPAKTVWILMTSKKSALLPTILSRSQILNFGKLEDGVLEKILLEQGMDKTTVAEVLKYAQGSVSKAKRSAEILEIISGLNVKSPAFPYELSASLDRTLAVARQEARLILDMFTLGIHDLWSKEADEVKKEKFKESLEGMAKYKRAVDRNVSPHLVLETAFMKNADLIQFIF